MLSITLAAQNTQTTVYLSLKHTPKNIIISLFEQ